MADQFQNLTESLSILGKGSHLSISQRQKIRDQLFKKIGQATLLDAVQTQTEVSDLIMPVDRLRAIFQPRRVALGWPGLMALMATVFIGTLTASAFAKDATPSQPLFPVRKTLEAFQIALTPNATAKAQLKVSIATSRVADAIAAGQVVGPQLETTLNESKQAIDSAKTAVLALQDSNGKVSQDLAGKLADVINTQRGILNDIVTNNVGNDKVRENVIALRDDLDKSLSAVVATTDGQTDGAIAKADPAKSDKPISKPTVTDPNAPITITGNLIAVYGVPALSVGAKTYVLLNSPLNLVPYLGQGNVTATGHLTDSGLVISVININDKLIGEWPPTQGTDANKNNNQSSRVESVPN